MLGGWRKQLQERTTADEAGFSLIEVIVMLLVLIVILLPIGGLLVTTGNVIATSRFRTQAEGVAAKELAAVQTLADGDASAFTATLPFTTLTAASPPIEPPASTTSWAYSAADQVQETIDTEVYTVTVDGDWCAVLGGGGSSATLGTSASSTSAVAFVVAIDVLWGPGTTVADESPGNHLVDVSTVVPPGGWQLPSGGLSPADLADCPAGLT